MTIWDYIVIFCIAFIGLFVLNSFVRKMPLKKNLFYTLVFSLLMPIWAMAFKNATNFRGKLAAFNLVWLTSLLIMLVRVKYFKHLDNPTSKQDGKQSFSSHHSAYHKEKTESQQSEAGEKEQKKIIDKTIDIKKTLDNRSTVSGSKIIDEEAIRKAALEEVSLEQIEEIIDEINMLTMRPMIRISEINRGPLPLTVSKYGGIPYLPKELMPPMDKDGNGLRLLAQINLKELPENDFFSVRQGILQFWISANKRYGMEDYTLTTKNTARVIFYEQVDERVSVEDVIEKYNPSTIKEEPFPVVDEVALEFSVGQEPLNSGDSYWTTLFLELWNKKYPELELLDEMEELPNAKSVLDYRSEYRSKLGGYPNFVQQDFREVRTLGEKEDKLLFQITSSKGPDGEVQVMWLDGGSAQFFIRDEDLRACDFSKVLYTWDSH